MACLNVIIVIFRFVLLFKLLLVFAETDPTNKTVLIGGNTTLACPVDGTGDVRWMIITSTISLTITTCHADGTCDDIHDFAQVFAHYGASSNSTYSILTIGVTTATKPLHTCVSDEGVLTSYNLVIITQEDIQPPMCHIPLFSNPGENGNV